MDGFSKNSNDLILGGMQSAGGAVGAGIQQQQQNAPASGMQKWLAKVIAGEMDPVEAAIHAKLEREGGGAPQGGMPQGQGGMPGGMQAPRSPPPYEPQTQKDFGALQQGAETFAKVRPRGMGVDDRLTIERTRQEGREKIVGTQQGGANERAGIRANTAAEAEKGKNARLQKTLAAQSEMLDRKLAAAWQRVPALALFPEKDRIIAVIRNLASMRSMAADFTRSEGFITDPAVKDLWMDLMMKVKDKELELDEMIGAPQGMPQGQDLSTPPIPQQGAPGEKVTVSNGQETLEIDPADLAEAAADGYRQVQ